MGEEGNNEEPRIPFPYEPYSIQKQFMTHVYQCVDQKKIGIFESPTGTVCGSYLVNKDGAK